MLSGINRNDKRDQADSKSLKFSKHEIDAPERYHVYANTH
jgi:hypothetical protein